MRPNSFHTWQQAEHDARKAAIALHIELGRPGDAPTDAMFENHQLLLRRASDALYELTLHCANESARLWGFSE